MATMFSLSDCLKQVGPYPTREEQLAKDLGISRANICFECANACGGCSWSSLDPVTERPKFELVPGWTATAVRLSVGKQQKIMTYHIVKCPLFKRG